MCLVMFGPFAHDLRPSAVFDWFSPRLAEVLRTTVECAAAARGFTGRSPFKADGLHYSFIIVSVYRAWKWRLKIAGICRNMKLHETVIYVLVYIYILLYCFVHREVWTYWSKFWFHWLQPRVEGQWPCSDAEGVAGDLQPQRMCCVTCQECLSMHVLKVTIVLLSESG